MNKQKIKKIINEECGFAPNKIILLEAFKNKFGKYEYIFFEVCAVKYCLCYCCIDHINFRYELQYFNQKERSFVDINKYNE